MAEGFVRKRDGAKPWEARIQHPWRKTPKGYPLTITKSFYLKKEASEWLATKRLELKSDLPGEPVHRPMTVEQACRRWLDVVCQEGEGARGPISSSTRISYRQIIENQIAPMHAEILDIGPMQAAELTPVQVRKWSRDLIEVHGHNMARRTLRLLKAAFRHAVGEGQLAANPASEIRLSPKRKSREDDGRIEIVLQPEDVADILAAVGELGTKRSLARDRALVRFLLETGARIGEALALEWRHVDLDAKTIDIAQTVSKADDEDSETATEGRSGSKLGAPKSRAGRRTIPMSDRLFEELKGWRFAQATSQGVRAEVLKGLGMSNVQIGKQLGISEAAVRKRLARSKDTAAAPPRFVFGAKGGATWLLPSNFHSDTWKPLLIAADVVDEDGEPAASPHDLRHYFASVAIGAGVSLEDLAYVLGHESIDVTLRHYHHLLGDKVERARGVIATVSAAMA